MNVIEQESGTRKLSRARRSAIVLAAFVIGMTVGIAPAIATAGTATSATGYYTIAGKQYRNFAKVYTSTGSATADTWAGPTSVSVAAGWVGVRGRLFTSGGALSCEGTNHYNGSTMLAGDLFVWNSCVRGGSGSWYSHGVSLGWNGSGYNSVYTFKSPNQNS